MIMNGLSRNASVTAEQSPVRANEAPDRSDVQDVARSVYDGVPEGVESQLSATDSPAHGSERE